MPLLSITRTLLSLLSLIILGFGLYLLWTWYQGNTVIDDEGVVHRIRDDWRLWTGLGLGAWSFLGRFLVVPLLAKPDTDPLKPERSNGTMLTSRSGVELYVETFGPQNAPTLVLTHGAASDSTVWFYAKRDLGRRFRIVTWDLPGLGRTKIPSPDLVGLSEYAAHLADVIEFAGPGKVWLVGHSMGGMTIQTLVRDFPQVLQRSVAGIVLVNTTYTNPLKTMILSGLAQALQPVIEAMEHVMIRLHPIVWLARWQSFLSGSTHIVSRLGFGSYVTRSQLRHMSLLSTRNPPANVEKGNIAMFHWDAQSALPTITVPVLVLAGLSDIVTKPEASSFIAAAIPNARVQTFEGAGHMGFIERHDEYNRAIGEFVEQGAGSTIVSASGDDAVHPAA